MLESDGHVFAHNPKRKESTKDFGEYDVDFIYIYLTIQNTPKSLYQSLGL